MAGISDGWRDAGTGPARLGHTLMSNPEVTVPTQIEIMIFVQVDLRRPWSGNSGVRPSGRGSENRIKSRTRTWPGPVPGLRVVRHSGRRAATVTARAACQAPAASVQ
jgi:hypothetical protein